MYSPPAELLVVRNIVAGSEPENPIVPLLRPPIAVPSDVELVKALPEDVGEYKLGSHGCQPI